MMRASHKQPGFLAALLHRLAGIALAIFLPLHFWALSGALNGADFLDKFLKVTDTPLVKFAEGGIVVALALAGLALCCDRLSRCVAVIAEDVG